MIRHYHFEKVRILAVSQEMFDLGKCDLGDRVIVRERSELFIVRSADQVLRIIIVEDQELRQFFETPIEIGLHSLACIQ